MLPTRNLISKLKITLETRKTIEILNLCNAIVGSLEKNKRKKQTNLFSDLNEESFV